MTSKNYDLDSLRRGVRNPSLIKKEATRRIARPIMSKILEKKYKNSTVYNYEGISGFPNKETDGIYKAFFNDLDVNKNNYQNFKTYLDMIEFANYARCESILEIGAGVSTAIWAQYASHTNVSVTSIDADIERINSYIKNTKHENNVRENVNLIEGVSIKPDDLRTYYASPLAEIGGLPVPKFAKTLDQFTRSKGSSPKQIHILSKEASTTDWNVNDVLISDGYIDFPVEYLQERTGDETIDEHASKLASIENTGVLNKLIESQNGWDMIWFDSGEVSSMVEWEILKSEVNPGGLAAFHDIFFPKSMKNFAVAASLIHDPNWKILLIDDSTKQGLLIAQKINS